MAGVARASYFFLQRIHFGGGEWGGGGERGEGVGGRTDEQAQAFKCDLGLQPR